MVRVSIENAAIFLLFAIAKTPRQRAIAEAFMLGRVTISRVIIIIVLGSITFNRVIMTLASYAIAKTKSDISTSCSLLSSEQSLP